MGFHHQFWVYSFQQKNFLRDVHFRTVLLVSEQFFFFLYGCCVVNSLNNNALR